jgi:hypothetical protein
MNYKILVAAIALPMSMTSLLIKPVSAANMPNFEAKQSANLVAQRYDPRHDNWNNDRDRREDYRQRLRERRQERRYFYNNRYYNNRVWIPGRYESGIFGIGRRWVPGHWEYR